MLPVDEAGNSAIFGVDEDVIWVEVWIFRLLTTCMQNEQLSGRGACPTYQDDGVLAGSAGLRVVWVRGMGPERGTSPRGKGIDRDDVFLVMDRCVGS